MKSTKFLNVVLILAITVIFSSFQIQQDHKVLFEKAKYTMETKADLQEAINLFESLIKTYPNEKEYVAKSLLYQGMCYEKLGNQEAVKKYQRVVNTFSDQTEVVAMAKARLTALNSSVGTGGLVTRRILSDASGVRGFLTSDGKYIRYMDRGTGDVVQFEVASGQTSRIKNSAFLGEQMSYIESYVFSRDERQIAFDIYTAEGKPQLRIRNLDGSNLHSIYDESSTIPFDWSPDGESILALRGTMTENVFDLVLISTNDSSVRVLKKIESGPYVLSRASFSPDGQFIAFSLVSDGNPPQGNVYLMTTDGRNEVVVAGHPAEDDLLAWAPDGRSLLFLSDRSGTWEMWTVRIAGGKQQGEPELLKKDFGRYSDFLGIAPNGSIYYKSVTPLGNLFLGDIDIESGKVLVPPAPVMTRFNGAPSRITWSPDGKNLLYISGGRALGNGNNNLTIRSAETGEERFLSTRLRNIWDIYWAPDSRNILAWGMTVKENALFRIDSETSETIKLADGRWAPRISKDGKNMVYMTGEEIRIRNLETNEESTGIKVGTETLKTFSDISPDGQELVFQDDSAVYTLPLTGGEPRKLFQGPSKYYKVNWTRNGNYIIAQAIDAKSGLYLSPGEMWRIPVKGGIPLKLGLNIPKMEFFALHPDNRHFAFSVYEGLKEELWVMENFLPLEQMTQKNGSENKEFSIRRIKEGLDVGILGAVSPDGRYLSYADDGPLDLAIYEIATGNKRLLVKGDISSDAYYSRWSPDSKQIAYTWYEDEKFDLRIVGLDGNKPRVLYKNDKVKWLELGDWSPDGKSLLSILSFKDRTYQMVLVSVQDGSMRVLKNFEEIKPGLCRFSPDGRYIAYTFPQDPKSEAHDIFILAMAGGSELPLVQHMADDCVLDWTPDGKGILFRSDRSGTAGAWWIRVVEGKSQGNPELIKPDLGPDFVPMGFTRNGLYYSGVLKEIKDVYIAELDFVTGKLIFAPNIATQRFVGSNESPDWSADGQQLIYLSQRAPGAWGARVLCVRSSGSGEVHELFSKLNQVVWIRWSPDGRYLVAAAQHPSGEFGTFQIDVQTGDFEHLMTPHIGWPAAWSLDSKAIYSYRSDSVTSRIPVVVRDIKTGQEKELYSLNFSDSTHYASSLALSRDGRQLAFAVSESGSKIIKVLPVIGGKAREVLRGDESLIPYLFGTIAWTPDGRNLLFVRQVSPGGIKTELCLIPLQGGEPRKLELTADNMHDLSVHPDGRHIAFTAGKPRTEIWVMENFLPKEETVTKKK